jgi:hypothetical protein
MAGLDIIVFIVRAGYLCVIKDSNLVLGNYYIVIEFFGIEIVE